MKNHPTKHFCSEVMISRGAYMQAQQKMDSIHQGAPGNACKLMKTETALRQDTRKRLLRDKPQKEQEVRAIAADHADRSCFRAQDMLRLSFHENYRELIKLPGQSQNKMAPPVAVEASGAGLLDENHKLRCFPNPFSEYTSIEAFVPDDYSGAKVLVYNTLGIKVKEFAAQQGYNVLTLWQEDMPNSGVYYYRLSWYGKILEQEKLVIIK